MSPSAAELVDGVVPLGGRPVLRHVSFRVGEGEVVALLGANGSGKSTLVRALIGLVATTSGSVRLFGTPLTKFRDWRRVGYVPQRTTAAAGVPATVRELVESGRLAHRGPSRLLTRKDREAVAEALSIVGLADRASESVARLSGGQQQRVLIARALAGRPDLLILDEPMTGVDVVNQETLALALDQLREQGTAIVLVLHELAALDGLIDRAVVLRAGQVVHDGPAPPAVGHHALPGHDHVHPHGPKVGEGVAGLDSWPTVPFSASKPEHG